MSQGPGSRYVIQGVGQSGCPGGANSSVFTYAGQSFSQLLDNFSVIQASCKLTVLIILAHFSNKHIIIILEYVA